jgi:hypothetical protein
MPASIHRCFFFVAMFCLLAGCGPSRPATVPVSGHVTWQGKPVVEGRITFYPATGRPATAAIGPDGVYHLRTFEADDGAVPGKHCVTIEAKHCSRPKQPKSIEQEMREGFASDDREPKVEWLVPEKYSQQGTSPLTAEVTADTKTIDFNLP